MSSTYVVFAVDGGDRLTLLCPPNPEKPRELKQIALSFIQAPKLAKRQATGELGKDDPCAYESMELIRSQCLGKQVRFEDDFLIEPLQRMSGKLTLPSGEDAAELLLKSGLATVPERLPARMSKDLFEKYTRLSADAKAQKKGLFAPNAKSMVRKLTILDASGAPAALSALQAVNGGEEKVRVDRVLSASSLIVNIASLGLQAQLSLAGVVAPVDRDSDVAADAKFYTEKFLLHRIVTVLFAGLDHHGNLVGSVVSPKGTFQAELAGRGLVKVSGATLGYAGAAADAIKAAEKEAQQKRIGVWKDYVEPGTMLAVSNSDPAVAAGSVIPVGGAGATSGAELKFDGSREFSGVVTQVVSGDTIVVRDNATGKFVKMSLSGLRTSKNVLRDNDGRSPETRVTYTEYAWEARELLRTLFIGKTVCVYVDYLRTIQETREVRPMATVVEEGTRTNAAAAVLQAGYGTFFLGRNDTCVQAVELQAAERLAKDTAAGLHSEKEGPTTKVVELARLGDSKGKYYLSFLHRGMQGNRPPVWRGVVDIVLGGGSFRVYIPKEHFVIPFKLAGVVAPNGATQPGEVADPFAAESKEFAVLRLQQREVDIQVDTSDRAGNFIGNLSLVGGPNFAVSLVEAGLATVSNAARLPYGQALLAAEASAKAAGKFIWSAEGGVPQRQSRMDAQKNALAADVLRPAAEAESHWLAVSLADVEDGNTVFLHDASPAACEQRKAIREALQAASAGSGYSPAKGEIVCALFREDGSWNRAKVLNVYKDDSYAEVLFIDYGTRQEVKIRDLRPTPKEGILREAPPAVITAKLAFLKDSKADAEYADTAYDEVHAFAAEESLFAKCVYTNAKSKYYLIARAKLDGPSSASLTLNEHLLKSAVALLDKSAITLPHVATWTKAMRAAEDAAKRSRQRLWKFGDVGDDSDADD